jgi:hypothetical protein
MIRGSSYGVLNRLQSGHQSAKVRRQFPLSEHGGHDRTLSSLAPVAIDLACVKTQKSEKRREESFSIRRNRICLRRAAR